MFSKPMLAASVAQDSRSLGLASKAGNLRIGLRSYGRDYFYFGYAYFYAYYVGGALRVRGAEAGT